MNRRDWLRRSTRATTASLVAAGGGVLWPVVARATPESMADAMREAFGAIPALSARVTLDIAPLAEDGNVVPVSIAVDSPMTEADHVRELWLFAERNPLPRVARFVLGPHVPQARVATRMRLAESQQVFAVARFADGTTGAAVKPVEVTRTACG